MNTKPYLMCGAALAAVVAAPAFARSNSGAEPTVVIPDNLNDQVQAATTPAGAPAVAKPTEAESSDQKKTGIQDIIVTARRRSESAQTVPVAVSVASAAALEQHQVLNTYQLVNLTPSLQVQSANQQAGAVNFTIRGVGTTPIGPQTESSVGVVIDDVAMSRPQFGNVQFSISIELRFCAARKACCLARMPLPA